MPNELKYYTDESFLSRDNSDIAYGFFTRLGGGSSGLYDGLNCGTGSNDSLGTVVNNRSLVAKETKVSADNLLSTYQVHGSKVILVNEAWIDRPHADAMVTDKKGFGLGILTADCTPVLFVGKKANGERVIGAAHAGWKGAVSGALENTVSAMIDLGAQKETLRACIGPCIGKASYEVSGEFIKPFFAHNEESERFFHASSKAGHLMFDIGGYCAWRLALYGISNISILDKDTYLNEAEFYSYRRSVHKAEDDYGRQISMIAIR